MAKIAQTHLFSWKEIDAASDLHRLILVLDVLPDEPLVSFLETRRGRGRDDYPVRPTWNALIAGIVIGHESIASLRRELRRNAELRQVCGFDPFAGTDAVPTDDAMSRFLTLVIEHGHLVVEMFDRLVGMLEVELPDLGTHLAVDSKAIPSHGNPVRDETKMAQKDRRRDTDADFGSKTYKGVRRDGSCWEKVKKWFGYKLHLIVDSDYELPLAFCLEKASSGDPDHMMPLLHELADRHPGIAGTAREIAADKAYDTLECNSQPFDDYGIRPVIDIRDLWKDEKTRPLVPDRVDSFIHDEKGNVSCVCPTTGETRKMCFCGFEKDRGTLKYRCPATAQGFVCRGRAECEARASSGRFGRVVRVPIERNRRTFTPIPRNTRRWAVAYARRTAVERVNSRLDQVLGFERHFIRGQDKMQVRVTLALVVVLAMALGRIEANQRELMRSIVKPVAMAA